MTYAIHVLQYFKSPQHVGRLVPYQVQVEDAAHGDRLQLSSDGQQFRFYCMGSPAAIAAAEWCCEQAEDHMVASGRDIDSFSAADIIQALELRPQQHHIAIMVAKGYQQLFAALQQTI